MSEVIIYEDDQRLSQDRVRLEGKTVRPTQRQMARLFKTSTEDIPADGELRETATTEDFSVVQAEGRREVARS